MTTDFAQEVIDAIRQLYETNEAARALFDWTAQRERDATSTSIDRISNQLRISRGEAVALSRLLEEANCGEFIVGRRGQKSRFRWNYSCVSLGQAASGESSNLEKADNPIPESEEDSFDEPSDKFDLTHLKLTIAEAKSVLANSLGVSVSNIEIIVKA
ncbi:hypothetical protein SAMN05519103_02585 [Rhizobiales bacterium GAS113]|nr:hypothetical protein SAMN05519103_02585 [Rhizobiales bacterium GAS113]